MKCESCQQDNKNKAVFCSNCGKRIVAEVAEEYEAHVKKISVFFFTLLLYIAILHLTKLATDFTTTVIADVIFIAIVIVFTIIHYSSIKPQFTLRSLKPLALLLVPIVAIGFAFVVHGVASFMNRSLFDREESTYLTHYLETSNPLFYAILSIGVMPAIFEEIAFRGILFRELEMITTKPAVILITSILFTLLHFSLLSVIWLFPGALALGYLRAKYNTIAYGVLAHFTYNTSIVLIQYYTLRTVMPI